MAPISPGVAISLGSGLAVGLLGVVVALSGSRRRSTVSFSAFLLVWSGLLVAGNLSRIPAGSGDLAASRTWLLVLSAFLVVIYLPLVHFAETFPTDQGWLVSTRAGTTLLVAPAVAGGIAMLVDPSLFHTGFREIGGSLQSDWGSMFLLFNTLFEGAFYLLVIRLVGQIRNAQAEIERLRARDLLLALSLHLSFSRAESTILFGTSVGSGTYLRQDIVFVATYGIGLVVMAWAGRVVARQSEGGAQLALGAVALPAVFGAVSAVTRVVPALPPILTRGLWRLLAVGLIAYAVLRYEMFDVDVRATRGVTLAGVFVAILALGVGAATVVESAFGSGDLGTVTGIAVAGGLLLGMAHSRPGFLVALESRVGAPSRLDRRRLEVYEAAVARDRTRDETAGRALDRLREDLDLTEAEAALLEQHVREGRVGGQPPEPEVGTVVGDRYELQAPAGAGQRGRAWKARDRQGGGAVVVKILDRPLTDREAVYGFLRESRAARRVDDPHVVTVHEVGLHGSHPFLVLDHVAGGSLDDHIEKEGALDSRRALGVVDDVLAGLSALHEADLVHRDVKAGNVLLREDGTAVVADLDLAAPVEDPDATVTGLGDVGRAGTPSTMSPEVAAGEPATPASDVYAAGALLHLLLAGEPYVDLTGVRPGDIAARIRSADPPSLPDVPGGIEAVVRTALRTDPAERYPDAAAMRRALRQAL